MIAAPDVLEPTKRGPGVLISPPAVTPSWPPFTMEIDWPTPACKVEGMPLVDSPIILIVLLVGV